MTADRNEAQMPGKERMPMTVWALGVVSLFTDVGGEMIFPILPAFLASLHGAGAEAVGLVEGVADGISHVVKPLVGRLSDRHGGRRKVWVALGYGLSGASRPVLGVATTVGAATVVRSSDRLGKGIRSAPRDALIAGSVSRERHARAFAVQQAMDHVGAVAGPLVAASLLGLGLSMPQVFLASAVPGVLAFATVIFFVKESSLRTAEARPADPPPPEAAAEALPARLRSYLAILFVFALGGSTDALLLLHAGNAGLTPLHVTWLYSGFNAVKAITNPPGGAIADRMGPVPSILAGWLLYAAVYAGFAAARGPAAVIALLLVYGLYYGFAEGAEKAVVSRMVTPATRGRAFGIMGFAQGAGMLIASLGTGWLYKHAGPAWAFGTGAAFAFLAVAALFVWSRATRPSTAS